jgi:predicted SAM-dependent methyltransferase
MFQRIKQHIKNSLVSDQAIGHVQQQPQVSQRQLIGDLSRIPHWEHKIDLYNRYEYSVPNGRWLSKDSTGHEIAMPRIEAPTHVNYGCGGNLMSGWLNIDMYDSDAPNYRHINLLEKHPFQDSSVKFGFSEDMLEHLNQAESIFLLSEIHRTAAPNGVIRLSFPGLEGVLSRHYSPPSEERMRKGEFEAYSFWDHIHFYSKEELSLVAKHVGFREVHFTEYGESRYPELRNLDTRESQIGLNTYVELTK